MCAFRVIVRVVCFDERLLLLIVFSCLEDGGSNLTTVGLAYTVVFLKKLKFTKKYEGV